MAGPEVHPNCPHRREATLNSGEVAANAEKMTEGVVDVTAVKDQYYVIATN